MLRILASGLKTGLQSKTNRVYLVALAGKPTQLSQYNRLTPLKETFMPIVKYEVEMTPENAPLIDQINRLVMGETYTEEAPAKTASKPATKPAAKTEEKDAGGSAEEEMSLADFKAVVKKAKADNGEEFCKEILEANGAKAGPLGRMVSAIDADDYADVVAALEAGPTDSGKEEADEEEEDDGFGDEEEDDDSEVDAEAVKKAAKAYAKEVGRDEAKEIMNKHGAATLTKIGDCSDKQLQAMFKEFTA